MSRDNVQFTPASVNNENRFITSLRRDHNYLFNNQIRQQNIYTQGLIPSPPYVPLVPTNQAPIYSKIHKDNINYNTINKSQSG